MSKETMNIHQALSDLKVLDARISKLIFGCPFVLANKNGNEKINGKTLDMNRDEIKSTYQKIRSLIDRRAAMRKALVLSNARTTVMLCGKEMTVAEAIEMKNSGIGVYETLLKCLRENYADANKIVSAHSGDAIERDVERYVLNILGQQSKETKAANVELIRALREDYIKNNTYSLIDPLKVQEVIKELEQFVDDFTANVDSVLATSNATTIITFEY